MEDTNLYTKISALPNELKAEVNDFVDFLRSKKNRSRNLVVRKERYTYHLILMNHWMILKTIWDKVDIK